MIAIFIVVIIFIVIGMTVKESKIEKKLQREIRRIYAEKYRTEEKYKNEINYLESCLKELKKEISFLSKYQKIPDLEAEEKKLKEKIEQNQKKANDIIANATKYYNEVTHRAALDAENIKNKLDEKLQDAVKTIDKWQYIENLINGYDKFFMPDYSVFDELSQRYSFSEVGSMLESSRARTKYLLNNDLALVSTFTKEQEEAKKLFSSFYLRCFENKLELLLSKVKTKSFTIIEQEIRDCFTEINSLCSMFNYRVEITTDYLEAKIDEFRWIYRLNDFIQKRKEEDAARREEQREKLKAQKEIEKAILKKQKEMDTIKDEIQKLTLDMKNLPDESIEKEQKKLELRKKEEKLKKLTEIQNKAKSMREMGYIGGVVYIISNKGSYGENTYKIGVTQRYDDVECCFAPEKRVHELFSSGVPFPFDIHAFIETEDAYELEKKLHNKFCLQRLNKVNKYKEFFTVSINEIKEYVESLGFYPKWTLESEIAQWKETQKINKKLSEDAIFRDNFIKEWEKTIFYNEEELETK